MAKREEIELKIEDVEDGAFAISLVDSPAIESDFVFLSEHKIELKVTDSDKREVIGLALIPEKRIFRRVKNKEFDIFFSEETVAKTAERYLERLNLNNVTVEHDQKVNGISVVESWIVENPEMDKSNIYNLGAVKGSWAVKMKVNNDEIWNDIKLGKYKGLSIEALFSGLKDFLASSEETNEQRVIRELREFLKSI